MPAFGIPAFVLPNIPPGKVVQIVSATNGSQVVSSSSVYADTGLTATITPTSAANKVLVFVIQVGCAKDTSNTGLALRLFRNAVQIAQVESALGSTASVAANYVGATGGCYVDLPATNTAVIYKTQFASVQNTGSVYVGVSGCTSSIVLVEITT